MRRRGRARSYVSSGLVPPRRIEPQEGPLVSCRGAGLRMYCIAGMVRENRSVAALVIATWMVGVAPVLLGGRTLASEPHLAATLPWFDRLALAVRGARLPEWDDASGLG